MLEFESVSKSFWTGSQRKVILDRELFRVELGHSLGILAPNGTGKTTLINMMAGLEKPDEGVIRRECRISFPLGFMGGVVSRVSAVENSRFIARLYGLDPDYVEFSAAGCVVWANISNSPWAPILRVCGHGLPLRCCWRWILTFT